MSLKSIKNKIRSVGRTHKVTKAMEAVSAVKMRKSQERALDGRPYAASALRILRRISGSVDAATHPLTQTREGGKTLFLVVTSDKGLAGSLNTAVIKRTVKAIRELDCTKEDTRFLCLGTKGKDHFSKRNYRVVRQFENVGDDVSAEEMKEITDAAIELFLKGEVDRVYAAYTNFRSTFEQEAVLRQVLPIDMEEVAKIINGILPEKGKGAEKVENEQGPSVYLIEPDPEEVFTELLPFLLNIELYHALLEAKASEHSARMVAMKNASDKAEEMSEELNLEFNKERQTLITREVSEIIGGMEVMNK